MAFISFIVERNTCGVTNDGMVQKREYNGGFSCVYMPLHVTRGGGGSAHASTRHGTVVRKNTSTIQPDNNREEWVLCE